MPKNKSNTTTTNNGSYEDEILISHHQALGNLVFTGSIGSSAKEVRVNTINIDKVSEGTMLLLQRDFKNNYDYLKLRENAIENLKEFMQEHKLSDEDISSNKNKAEQERLKKIKKLKIENEIQSIVKQSLHNKNKIQVQMEDFFSMMNIASFYRTGKIALASAVNTINEIQDRATIDSVTKQVVYDETIKKLVIEKKFTRTKLIPKISFVLDDNAPFADINELKTSRVHNKEKYIKYMEIEFDIETYAERVAPIMNYITAYPSIRSKYKTGYSRIFDNWMRSLYRIQSYTSVNRFTFDDLNKKFGLNYNLYGGFKHKVLSMVIKDFNTNIDMKVELKEVFSGNKLDYVYFVITKIGDDGLTESEKNNFYDLSYYIAVQHKYMTTKKGEYVNFLEHQEDLKYYTSNIEKYRDVPYFQNNIIDKTFGEWEAEHKQAINAFEKLKIAEQKDPQWFNARNVKVSPRKLCLVDRDTEDIYKILNGVIELHNPILSYSHYLETNGAKR